jgi:hypothetical protein
VPVTSARERDEYPDGGYEGSTLQRLFAEEEEHFSALLEAAQGLDEKEDPAAVVHEPLDLHEPSDYDDNLIIIFGDGDEPLHLPLEATDQPKSPRRRRTTVTFSPSPVNPNPNPECHARSSRMQAISQVLLLLLASEG